MLVFNLPRLFALLFVSLIVLVACGGQPSAPLPTSFHQPSAVPAPTAVATRTAVPAPTTAAAGESLATAAPASSATVAPTAVPNPTADPITGAPGLARGTLTKRPYIVMIDNHPNAYPQTGLDHAAVVFEALAEFGVTRFMAVFAPDITPDAPQIGPVRSTRLYFAQWAIGFHGLYAHAGGSPQGLKLVESTDQLINLDALHGGSSAYFARSSDRDPPHNLYTSSANLVRAAKDRGVADFAHPEVGFLFKSNAPPAQRPSSQRFSYFFIYPQDEVGWTYDPKTNGYFRLRRGKPARDAATDAQLWTKNVVLIEIQESKIADDPKGRIDQTVVGSGHARLFMDGVEREMSWRKDEQAAPLSFYDVLGDEVRLNAGPVWIAALPSLDNLTVE